MITPTIWHVGRGTNLYGQVLEASGGTAEAGKDISAAGLSVVFRAYLGAADAAYLKNVALSKTTGTAGYFTGYIPAFTAAYARLYAEIVLVDTGTADAGTPSTYKELLLERVDINVRDTAT